MTEATSSQPSGSIYDLGYRHYDGPRLGRRHAFAVLFRSSLRSVFGLGRGGRAKIVPWFLSGLILLPAIAALAITGLIGTRLGPGGPGAGPGGGPGQRLTTLIDYPNYYSDVAQFLFLFVAAQAPELLGRDQRFQVLTLYFSRALRRRDYVVARFLALAASLFGVLLAPQVLLYLGRALAAADVAAGLRADAGRIAPVVAQAALVALVLTALGLAISAFTPRRAYAIAAIIAAIIVPPIVSGVVAGGDLAAYVRLISVSDVLKGTNDFVFGLPTFSPDSNPILTPPVAVVVALVGSAVLLAVILRRYARISA